MPKVALIFGTRPECIKMAPVIKALEETDGIDVATISSGQHKEMLEQVYRWFHLAPHEDLSIMRADQTLFDITTSTLSGLQRIFAGEKFDLALVHGDTTTTLAATLAAFYSGIPVGHVEAGLRTYTYQAPWPEEMNRHVVDHVAALHFAPTELARQHLVQEHIPEEGIFLTGNTVIDALLTVVEPEYRFPDPRLASLDGRVLLITAHRRESFGAPLEAAFHAILDIVEAEPDLTAVYPVHRNPHVLEPAHRILGGHPRIRLIEPLDYKDFSNLMARCTLILSDSGGVQEEAPTLGKPVLVLREVTERPEALDAGTARLVGCDRERIVATALTLLRDSCEYDKMAKAANPFGDGTAGKKIAQIVKQFLCS
ncbi:UDP-N-acetylglucosamine 2-epimerase (non-hydrolyzing) [bacterium]|nr:UDP-N-acetylglucosamine 2-epimerase (non-hydrolyzing) [bacterium]